MTALVTGTLVAAMPAHAAPEYEIEGEWIAQPANVARGRPIVAQWLVNVNDDQPAAANEPVDNVLATFTTVNGIFDGIPDICKTTDVTPPSSINTDGTILTCNFGTVIEGTAIAVQTPVLADGLTGDLVQLDASYMGQTDDVPDIPIVNPFRMDIMYGQNTTFRNWNDTFTAVDLDMEFTLRIQKGSDPGPANATYRLNVTAANGEGVARNVNIGDNPRLDGQQSCTNFFLGTAQGHPWSGRNLPGDERNGRFVDSCTLVEVPGQPGVFDLTLTGINYDLLGIPELDSTGGTLPPAWDVVASGSLWFRVITPDGGSIRLDSNEPTYVSSSPQQQQSTDIATNNVTTKTYALQGSFSHAWVRGYTGSGGTPWDDSYRVAAGTTIAQQAHGLFGADAVPATARYGNCIAFDYRYVRLDPTPTPFPNGTVPSTLEVYKYDSVEGQDLIPGATGFTFEYYTGASALLNPDSPQYNPDQFVCSGTAGWSTTPPADLANVKAVRILYNHSAYEANEAEGLILRAYTEVQPNAQAGQDVWTFGSVLRNNGPEWLGIGEPWLSSQYTPTPGSRYPATNGRRDIVRIIDAQPFIEKEVSQTTVSPGVPVDYTLRYSANSSGGVIPPTVDDFQIIDTLPVGMTYEPGSTLPPELGDPVITQNDDNEDVLTWTIDGLPTNLEREMTYQASADSGVAPGAPLTNTVVAVLGEGTSRPDTVTVTTITNGYTAILKTTDFGYITNLEGTGTGTGTWTVSITSVDPTPQPFTDTIDILPYIGDGRGTAYSGTYALEAVTAAGGTVYYTDADPTDPVVGLTDDPDALSNGGRGTIVGNTVGWSTTRPANVTAIRVIGPALPPGGTFEFDVSIATEGAAPGDVYMNRAQARAGHTELVMRTSEPLILANFYDYTLKKYVQDTNGVWHDAQEPIDYPSFDLGDTINYRIVVTNTGTGDLTNIPVTDNVFNQGSFLIPSLPAVAPGNVVTHEFSVVADESMMGTLVNTACATVLDTPPDALEPPEDVCDPGGVFVFDTDFDKVLIGKVPNGDGTYTITYDVTAIRDGDGPNYNMIDTLRYGASATIVSTAVTNTVPGGIPTNPGWNGTSDVAVASDVPIADGETHTYRMTVVASIDEPATTAAMSDCDLGGDAGTGFHNTAQLTTGTRVFMDDACVEYPAPVIAKAIASGPTDLGNGQYSVTYDITATNNGVDPTTYDLDDTLKYGNGISIVSTTVSNSSPGGIATSGSWNGTGDIRVATAVPIGGVTVHTYTATVTFTVAGGISAEAMNCTFAGSESGTGLFNTATLTNNGETRIADACAVPPQPTPPSPPPPPSTGVQDPGELPATGGGNLQTVQIALAVLALGIVALLVTRRRRRAVLG